MSVIRSTVERLPNGEIRYVNTYGLARPVTREQAVWVATNRLIRRSCDAARRVCKPGQEGAYMPPIETLRAAAQILVPA
jgi:hypothetical protein